MASQSLRIHGHLQRSSQLVKLSMTSPIALLSRSASTDAHTYAAEDHSDSPPESFTTPFWRNTIIFSILGYGLYKVAPSRESLDGQDNSLTSFIRKSITPSDVWKTRNENHLALSVDSAQAKQLTETARRPVVSRIRYTGKFEDFSPHRQSVGDSVDMSDLDIKSDSHMRK
ncbi:hypothetical protein FRB95_008439 [Tulasnella sp. JGI-2019a]|nr:hypothetical protein FRB95_008439 [Tulasnella sp. JGI-2019a]